MMLNVKNDYGSFFLMISPSLLLVCNFSILVFLSHFPLGVFFCLYYKSSYWMKYYSFRLAVINMFQVFVSSELLLSTRLPISEGWTAELTVGL